LLYSAYTYPSYLLPKVQIAGGLRNPGMCIYVYIYVHAFFRPCPAKCLELPRLFHVGVHCDSLPLYSSIVPTQHSAGPSKTDLCLLLSAAFCLSLSFNINPISRPSTSLLSLISSIQIQRAIEPRQYSWNFTLLQTLRINDFKMINVKTIRLFLLCAKILINR